MRTQSYLGTLFVTLDLHRNTRSTNSELLHNLHVHIAPGLRVVQLICSWCFCTCRSLMSTRVGFEEIFRCLGRAGAVHQKEPALYPRRHDGVRILCSTLATDRKGSAHHDEDSPSHHNRSGCSFVAAAPGTPAARLN
jgi:hypothetical protein